MKNVSLTRIMSVLAAIIVFVAPVRSQQSVEDLMASGSGLLKNGSYTEAAGIFRKVVSMEPRNFEAQYNLAFAYLQSERYDKAVAEFNKALSLEPKNADCWANIGFAYERLGKTQKAADAISRSVELNPNNVEARMNLAAMYENANAFDKAIAHYEAVIKIDGSRSDAYNGVARCLSDKGNVPGAKKYLQEAISKDANNAEAHWLMANILWKKENNAVEAFKEYRTSITLDPNSQVFYENMALLQEEMGNKEDAIETWKKYLIYLNEAIKKEEVQKRIDKLERGETPGATPKSEAKINRDKSSQESAERMNALKSELRNDKKSDAKRLETQPVDIGSDIANISKDTSNAIDLRKEAKRKAESKKESQ